MPPHKMTNKNNSKTANLSVRFSEWEFDFTDEKLMHINVSGQKNDIELENICRKTLSYLLKHSDRVVTNDELLSNVWGVTGVTHERIPRAMSIIRTTLGDTPANPKFIKTVSKTGYQFIGKIDVEGQENAPQKAASNGTRKALLILIAIILCIIIYALGFKVKDFMGNDTLSFVPRNLPDTMMYPHSYSLSPDSEAIVLVSDSEVGFPNVGGDIIIKKLNANEIVPLVTKVGDEIFFVPVWHPTKNIIAYRRLIPRKLCEIHVITLSSDLNSIVSRSEPIKCSAKLLFIGFMDWSSDGESIIYSDYSSSSANMAIFRVNTRTRNIDQLTTAPKSSVGDYYGRASRITSEVIFLRDVSRTVAQLWTLDVNTLEQKLKFTFPGKVYPSFIDFAEDGINYLYQDHAGQFTVINKDDLSQRAISKPTAKVDSIRHSKTGGIYASSLVPEEWILVTVNNPFVAGVGKQDTIKVGFQYSANPVAGKPDAFFSNTLGGSELWIDYKDGRKKILQRFMTQHFNSKANFSHTGDKIVVVNGDKVWVSDLENKPSLISKEGQMLLRPSWGGDGNIVYAIDTQDDWNLLSIDVKTGKQTKYLDGVSFFRQSPDGRHEIIVKFNSNDILLKDNSDGSILKLDLADYMNGKDLMVFFRGNYAYIKCAKCTLPKHEPEQLLMRVNLTDKTYEVRGLEVTGDSREFLVSEDGTKLILDSKSNRKIFRLQVLEH